MLPTSVVDASTASRSDISDESAHRSSDFTQRTLEIAKIQASNLLDQIHRSLEQAVTHQSIQGTLGKPAGRALFLVGHDTNISKIAGLLNMTWIVDGRRDDTPPGGALIIELWKNRKSEDYSVRLYYTAQTLEQMRSTATLSPTNPPQRAPFFSLAAAKRISPAHGQNSRTQSGRQLTQDM